jgi:hypothetical protein
MKPDGRHTPLVRRLGVDLIQETQGVLDEFLIEDNLAPATESALELGQKTVRSLKFRDFVNHEGALHAAHRLSALGKERLNFCGSGSPAYPAK